MQTEHMPIAEWADYRSITEAEAIRWIARAGVKPSSRGMSPSQWKKLDMYVYKTTGKVCGDALR